MRAKLLTLLKNAGQVYAAQMIGLLVSFGISIIVARQLGAEGRGAYGWIMALYFLAIQFGQLGTDTLNRRMGATNPAMAAQLAGNSLLQAVVLGTLSAIGLFVFGYLQPLGQMYPFSLALAVFIAPLAISLSTWNGLATGLGHGRIIAATEILQRLGIVAVVVLFLLTTRLEVWHLVAAQLVGVGIAAAFAGNCLHKLLKGRWSFDLALFRHEHKMILMAFGAGLCIQLLQKMDLLMLAAWRPISEAGHYAIAQTLMDTMLMVPGIIGFMLMPGLAGEESHRNRRTMLLTVLGGSMVFMAVSCCVAALLSPWFIPLLFGEDFREAVPVFQRLMLATIIVAGFQVCQNAVAGIRRARHIIIAPLVGVILKAALGYYLVPLGMLAAVNASIIAYGGAFAVSLLLVMKGTRP